MRTSLRVAGLALSLAAMSVAALVARQSSAPKPAARPAGTAPAPASPAPRDKVSTPPLLTAGYAGARPMGITRAVYDFAAQHPEVLKYVPCYCGCEADGHPHNESCFVKARDASGNVTQWDMHGFG